MFISVCWISVVYNMRNIWLIVPFVSPVPVGALLEASWVTNLDIDAIRLKDIHVKRINGLQLTVLIRMVQQNN